jgi:hypothetical protein
VPELGRVGDRIAYAVRAGYKARSARGCSGELIRMALPSLESGEILDKERISGSTSTLNFPAWFVYTYCNFGRIIATHRVWTLVIESFWGLIR